MQGVRAKGVGQELDEWRSDPLELAWKLIDRGAFGGIGLMRQVNNAARRKPVIKRPEGVGEPLRLCLGEDLPALESVRPVQR